MSRLFQVLSGVLVTRVLDRIGGRSRRARRSADVPAAARTAARAAPHPGVSKPVAPAHPLAPPPPAPRRARLRVFMLAALTVGAILMFVFEATVTRVIGVVALFAFVVSGVFLIADPAMLDADDEAAT
jgi:hypothetical protein